MRARDNSAVGGACYKRRNDDCGSSFRNRDKLRLNALFRLRNDICQAIDFAKDREDE
jgi:hypothetical protein